MRHTTTGGAPEPLGPKVELRKRARGGRKRIKWTGFLLFLLLAAGAACLLSGKVETVELQGLSRLEEKEISDFAGISGDLNRWELLTGSFPARVEAHPEIKEARYQNISLHRPVIEVVEREPGALVTGGGEYWLVDKEAVVIGNKSHSPEKEGLILITGLEGLRMEPGKDLGQTAYGTSIKSVVENREKWEESSIREINLSNLQNVRAFSGRGVEIWLGDSRNMSEKVELVYKGLPYVPVKDYSEPVDMRYHNMIVVPPR